MTSASTQLELTDNQANKYAAREALNKQIRRDVFKSNLSVIVKTLRDLGCTTATVEYSGEGDSGNTNDISLSPCIDIDGTVVQHQTVVSAFDQSTRLWDSSIVVTSSSLPVLLDSVCNEIITMAGHDGFENGDGGGGTFTLNVQIGQIQLQHYANVVTQEYSYHSLTAETGELVYGGDDSGHGDDDPSQTAIEYGQGSAGPSPSA